MKKQQESILTEKDYDYIIEQVAKNDNAAILERAISELEGKYTKSNSNFFALLHIAYEKSPYIYYGDPGQRDLLDHIYMDSFPDDLARNEYMSALLSEKLDRSILATMSAMHPLSRLSAMGSRLTKLDQSTGIRRRHRIDEIKKLATNLEKVGHLGIFNIEDINLASEEDLTLLVRTYFTTSQISSTAPEDAALFFPWKADAFISFKSEKAGADHFRILFQRVRKEVVANIPSAREDTFLRLELLRWRQVLKGLNNKIEEWQIVKRYIKFLEKGDSIIELPKEKTKSNEYSFGISKDHFNSIVRLCEDLSQIDLLHKSTPTHIFAEVLTTTDYREPGRKVYFGCATTTVCRVFELLANKFGASNLTHSTIGSSSIFYIPKSAKPHFDFHMEAPKDFKPLTRINAVNSLARFKKYMLEDGRKEQADRAYIQAAAKKLGEIKHL